MSNDRISDDLRYELADAARTTAAANRPRSLLVLATVLFAVGGVALIVTLRQRDRAVQSYHVQADRKVLVEGLALQFAALDSLDNAASNSANMPLNDILTRIESAATDAGLPVPPVPPPSRQPAIQGAIKVTYSYDVRNPSLESLLAWVQGAQENVPGLEVSSINLTPEPKGWRMEVKFVRWERAT